MKNHIATILTAVSSCLATLSFLAVFNPSAINLNKTDLSKKDNYSEIITATASKNITKIEEQLLYPTAVKANFGGEPFLGEIIMFGGNFAPRGWAFCSGQVLAISQYEALFSILGTMYGGDGRTTFALPDLRGRAPVHSGGSSQSGDPGPGLTARRVGEKGGVETNTLSLSGAAAGPGRSGNVTIPTASNVTNVNNMTPYLGVNYIIALEGLFPSRS